MVEVTRFSPWLYVEKMLLDNDLNLGWGHEVVIDLRPVNIIGNWLNEASNVTKELD
jgi:hypothetical protein